MGNYLLILFIISSPPWFGACNTESGHKKFSSAMLELTIKIPGIKLKLNEPLPVKVTLLSKCDTPLLVNTRMSVGYSKSLSRELFAELKNLDTGNTATYSPSDINRNFPVAGDYRLLLPGDSIFTSFNLLQYYPLKKSGHYELTLHYQADEELAETPAGVWKGIISSNATQFEILDGEMPGDN